MEKEIKCKTCSTDRIEKNGKRELKNNYSQFSKWGIGNLHFCDECEKWVNKKN